MGEYTTRDTGELERVLGYSSLKPEEMLRSDALIHNIPADELKRRLPPKALLKKERNLTLVLDKNAWYGSWAGYIFNLIGDLGKEADLGVENITEATIREFIATGQIDEHVARIHKDFENTGRCNDQTKAVYHKVKDIRALMRYEKRTGINLSDEARKIDNSGPKDK